jgi:hypothetical protein
MTIFKISLSQQIKLLLPMILKYSGLVCLYLYFFGLSIPTAYFFGVLVLILMFDTLPTLLLHIVYFFNDFKQVLSIEKNCRYFILTRNGEKNKILIDEVQQVQIVYSYGRDTGVYSFGQYCFCRILLSDRREFCVTCLSVNQIEKTMTKELGVIPKKQFKLLPILISK